MTNIKTFIGSPIEHASDRAVLERITALLSAKGLSAIILANINISGRQIDLVLVLPSLTLVIEAKGYTSPIRGGENGPWQVRVASGEWKTFPNPYIQVVQAKNALRDAMRSFANSAAPYPDAAVIFAPDLPIGSEVFSGDFKASVSDLASLPALLQKSGQNPWSFDQWQAFARHHQLTPVGKLEAAFDSQLRQAEDLLTSYLTAFQRTYAPLAASHVETACTHKGVPCTSQDMTERIATGASLLLQGASGCGKSLLSYAIGLAVIDKGHVPVLISSKDFEGQLRDMVGHEAGLLDAPSGPALIGAARRLDRRLLLIVDGYNECRETERVRLTRAIAAAARRYEAGIVVSTQVPLERPDLLQLHEVAVPVPDDATKSRIARTFAPNNLITPAIEALLDAASSGLEARLAGEVAGLIAPGASRFALYDAYVRLRLRESATEGIRTLACIAGVLADRVTFSLTVRDLDRLSEQERLSSDILRQLFTARLLTQRGDRVSFSHELFMNAFAAEAVVRKFADRFCDLPTALRSPRHEAHKTLVLGAIDNDTALRQLLDQLSDPGLIESCSLGHCGHHAQIWVRARCRDILSRITQEAAQVSFEISAKGWWGVAVVPSSLLAWSPQERAFFPVIAELAKNGYLIDETLEAVGAMDRRLASEFQRLRPLLRDDKIALRSSLFANTYVSFSSSDTFGIASVCGQIHGGSFSSSNEAAAAIVCNRLTRFQGSNGQLYILLALHRRAWIKAPSIAALLPDLLARYWRGAEYHLRLDILQAAHFCSPASEAERLSLIQTLEALPSPAHPFISTSLIEALQSLGALRDDEDAHVEVVRSNIREVLADLDNPDMQSLADRIWFAQFDHPYEGAYSQAVAELAPADKKTLLAMAAKGTGDLTLFVSILIMELASFNDPAVGSLIVRWTEPPAATNHSPQEAIEVFAVAHIALARLGCPLPVHTAASPQEEALLVCGQILYWLNRADLSIALRHRECEGPLSRLVHDEHGAAADVIRELYHAYTLHGDGRLTRLPGVERPITSIGDSFPTEIARICRRCLHSPDRQLGYFQHLRIEELFRFSIESLGLWGNETDLPFLRQLSNNARLGASAIAAIKRLEVVKPIATGAEQTSHA